MALAKERKEISLDIEELTRFLYSYIYKDVPLARIREIRNKAAKIPELSLSTSRYNDSREESITRALKFGKTWIENVGIDNVRSEEQKIWYENSFELTAIVAHYMFFYPSFLIQASNDQIKEWDDKMKKMEISGCYAQTELGHGSDVKGLEIQAIYDHKTKEFILHSPTITATKWWIGGLGAAANHALIIAQLIINGNNYGPHPFLVQLRDLKTHEPLPGVDVGDIGPKIGLHSNDNGYCRFDNYRISKKYMLARFSKINDAGEYEIIDPNGIKILYLSLVKARLEILGDAWFPFSSALTIAIRYSIVRHQFSDPEDPTKEKKIIDYQIQQSKLFRELSKLYAMVFVRVEVIDLYLKAEKDATSGGSGSSLSIVHCLVCLYKVYASQFVLEGIEQCRRCCGGHGFMMISGLPSLYTTFLPKVTYDGENTILALQAIKYLLSLFHKKAPKEFAYITGPKIVPHGDPTSASFQQQCFEAVTQYKLQRLNIHFQELKTRFNKDRIWNDFLQIEGVEATEPAFYAHIHGCFAENVRRMPESKNKNAIENLRLIYAATGIERYSGILQRCGVTAESLDIIKAAMISAFQLIRPHALGLIEAFEIKDEALHSVLGRRDGNVYPEMLSMAKNNNPINKNKVFPGIEKYLKPKI